MLLAALVGLSLGLLGGGGSILTVPIFVYVLGFEAKPAIAMSLAVVGVTSLVGAAGHWRAGNVNPRAALTFAPAAVVSTFAGARLAAGVSASVQLIIFAVVLVLAAFLMLRGREGNAAPVASRGRGGPPLTWIVGAGIGVGLMTGLVGVGGGFLIVPALVLLARIPMKQAVGTSLLLIAANSAAGVAGYAGQVDVPWEIVLGFTAVATVAIVVGTYLVRFVPRDVLRRSFAVFLLVMGIFILYQNQATLAPVGQPAFLPATEQLAR